MDLGKLRQIVEALIEEEGEDAPVAVFYITSKDVQETLSYLKASGKIENDSQPRIKDVLEELQSNAGDPPFEDQIHENLEDLLIHWDDVRLDFGDCGVANEALGQVGYNVRGAQLDGGELKVSIQVNQIDSMPWRCAACQPSAAVCR